MASRISVSRARSVLAAFHESIMESANLYFVSSMTKWLSGMRGRSQAGSLASNARTQLLQSQFKDSKTGAMQILPEGHAWGTSGSIVRYSSIFVEPASAIVGLRMAVDVLLTRAQPPVIVYVACRALATMPKTLLASVVKKRLGSAGPAFVKWIAATNDLASAILEQGEKKRTRKKATAISWSEVSTPRKKKAKTPSKKAVATATMLARKVVAAPTEAEVCLIIEAKFPEIADTLNADQEILFAREMLLGTDLATLKAMPKLEMAGLIDSVAHREH